MKPISDTSQGGLSNNAADPVYRAKAQAAAEKFEAFFITDMLRQMRRSTQAIADADSPLNSRTNQDMLDLTDTLMGDTLAGQRAFGIADAILRQLLPAGPSFKVSPVPVAGAGKDPTEKP